MRFVIYLLLALAVLAHAQKKDEKKAVSGIQKGNKDDSRSFFTTAWTLLKYTTTTTSTFTSTTTCTTSTASLTTCTAGRRRRGLFYDEKEAAGRDRRGLFYNENEDKKEEGNAFLVPSDDPVEEVQSMKKDDGSNLIPLEIESGYKLPENLNANRFFFNIGTSTVTSVSISTTTLSITATCSSVTNFATCGASGK